MFLLPLGWLAICSYSVHLFFLNLVNYLPVQTVFENTLMKHHIALPPDAMGKITYIAPPGQYSITVSFF